MNWDLSRFKNKDVVFVGKGKGRALAGIEAFLGAHANYRSFKAIDKSADAEPWGFLRDYDQAQTVFIKNEAIPAEQMPVPYITQIQLFFELIKQVESIVIGITGTKGKSTTAALTAHILETAGKDVVLAGNIGLSPLHALDKATAETVFVLELSSYQLSDVTVSPHISACVNLFNDHADWHGSLEYYWEAKHNIMRFAMADDIFVYNPAFPALQHWADEAICKTIPIDVEQFLNLSNAQLFGEHNRLNALMAREIARLLAVDDATSQQAIDSFQPLNHRMQIIATKQGRTYVDDAIGMTPESTLASMTALSEKLGPIGCLLLGGQDRGYDFKPLLEAVALANIPNLVLFPDTIETMKALLPAGYAPNIFETKDMTEAVKYAAEHAPENSLVLLSTAAPSYSLWHDFEEKGDLFQTAVQALQ